jgi:TonB family protein
MRIVVPRYSAHDLPDLKAAATSGNALRIEVRIDVAGVVAKATALSGPEKLKKLALGAASQWRFPALPVESAKAERIGLIVFSFIPSTDWVWIVTGGQEHSHSLPAAPLEKNGQLPKPKDQGVIEQQQHGQNRCQEADIANARAQGSVEVQVLISEQGDVLAARAISGHPLLHAASVEAALKWKFKPTLQSGVPVKVAGILTFNYKLQPDRKPDMTRQ